MSTSKGNYNSGNIKHYHQRTYKRRKDSFEPDEVRRKELISTRESCSGRSEQQEIQVNSLT